MITKFKALTLTAALTGLCLPLQATIAQAGPIESACLQSDRGAGRSLCGCIQQVADTTLDRRDQRTAARFFKDPNRAQEVRMSKSDSDSQFWARYRQFGNAAEARCSSRS
jgi:hypothetical protein